MKKMLDWCCEHSYCIDIFQSFYYLYFIYFRWMMMLNLINCGESEGQLCRWFSFLWIRKFCSRWTCDGKIVFLAEKSIFKYVSFSGFLTKVITLLKKKLIRYQNLFLIFCYLFPTYGHVSLWLLYLCSGYFLTLVDAWYASVHWAALVTQHWASRNTVLCSCLLCRLYSSQYLYYVIMWL